MLKKILLVILLLLSLVVIIYHELIFYGIAQGYGQMRIVLGAKPIEEVLVSKEFPDSLNQKLLLIKEIKQYTVDSLGLKPSENYSKVYNQHGKALLYVLTACEAYSFTAKEWSFPIVGEVSYKGFFNKAKGEKEEQKLIAAGYDTDLGPTGGWSTLGWFKDPVLSNMLYKRRGHLAELIIHELTHGTIYIKSSVAFNENLAQFVGVEGAKRFLIAKYGPESKEYTNYIHDLDDEKRFTRHVFSGYKVLDSLYKNISNLSAAEKADKKKNCIVRIIKDIDTVAFYNPARYKRRLQYSQVNNTYFMEFKRYEEKQDLFSDELRLKFNGNLRSFVKSMTTQ